MKDALGVDHAPAAANARILSLVPSITETLFALDLADQMVGRTAFCVHPKPQVKMVPSVGGTKSINMAKVRAAAPTHAFVNIDENPKELAADLAAAGIEVIVTHPTKMTDNPPLYRLLGDLFARRPQAETLCTQFDAALQRASRCAGFKRVLYLIWNDPWMTVSPDTYISDALRTIGWETVSPGIETGDDTNRYPILDPSRPLPSCDVVMFSSEPFAFTPDHVHQFRAAFPNTTAPALFVDGEMLSWYGNRAIPALNYLSDLSDLATAGEE